MTSPSMVQGYPPNLAVGVGNPEAQKYGKMWKNPAYRNVAPGEMFAENFLVQANPRKGSHVIDFGSGTGRGAKIIHDSGMKVTMLDFIRDSLDVKVKDSLSDTLKFRKHDLMEQYHEFAEYGYCTDVMEHIPPEHVDRVIGNIVRTSKICYFAICTLEDEFGPAVGLVLHLSVHPHDWWEVAFAKMGCKILWDVKTEKHSHFLVSAWDGVQELVDSGSPNTSQELILENIRINCEGDYPQLVPHPQQETEIMILGGGPSLNDHLEKIKELRADGVKLVTMNGSYNWAIEHGLTPSATVMVDAREFNNRFVKPVVDDCKYFISSQCHPSVLEGLPKDRIILWHAAGTVLDESAVPKTYQTSYPVPGGTTVLLRTIPLFRTLGYYKYHIFGCDSCLSGEEHHAFSQPENDARGVVPIMVTGGRVFQCHPWMAAQAREWITLIQKIGEVIEMIVYGDGLLAHILNTGAEIEPDKED